MLLPETELMLAQDRIADRMRQSEIRKQMEDNRRQIEEAAHKESGHGWLRELFLGKASA